MKKAVSLTDDDKKKFKLPEDVPGIEQPTDISQRPRIAPQLTMPPPDVNTVIPTGGYAQSQFDDQTTNILGPGTLRQDYAQNVPNPEQPKTATPLTEYDQAKQEYLNTLKQKPNKQGRAAQIAFQVFKGMENMGKTILGQPQDPFEWLGEAKKGMRDQQAAKQFAPYLQQEQMKQAELQQQAQLRKTQVEALKGDIDVQKDVLDLIQKRNPKFYESLEKRGYITKEDATWAKENGYGNLAVGDFRKRDTKQIDENTYERPEIGNEPWKLSTLPPEKSKQLITRKLSDGTPYFTTGDKEADRAAQTAYRQAQLDFEVDKVNAQQVNEYADRLDRWSQTEAQRTSQLQGWREEAQRNSDDATVKTSRATELETQLTDDLKETDPKEYRRVAKEAQDLKDDARTLKNRADKATSDANRSKPLPMPTKPTATVPKQNITDKTMTKAEYDASVKKFGKAKADNLVKNGGWVVK